MTSVENWAARAAATGWDAMSLFGCHRERPLGRLGSVGLLWTVAGGKLIRLHSDWAVIETPNGAQQTFHRPPLAWCVREGMSNPVPVGSPRKSAAIIPFVNETLTSGLARGSIVPQFTFA